MAIEIKHGYLMLTAAFGPSRIEAVKGSAIVRVTTTDHNTTLVTVGSDGWSIEVLENIEQILAGVTQSYKEVTRH